MRQVAEELAAKRIVANVLNQAAAIRKSMGCSKIFRCGRRKALLQYRLDLVFQAMSTICSCVKTEYACEGILESNRVISETKASATR